MKLVRYHGRKRALKGQRALVTRETHGHYWVQFDCTALTRWHGGPLLGFNSHRFRQRDFTVEYVSDAQ